MMCTLRKVIRREGGLENVGGNGQGKTLILGKMIWGAGKLSKWKYPAGIWEYESDVSVAIILMWESVVKNDSWTTMKSWIPGKLSSLVVQLQL